MDGWDGTAAGVGRYESEEALQKVFGQFGPVLGATVRHRVENGKNTSWALVAMGTAEAVDVAMNADEITAGETPLVVNYFDRETARSSKGAMKRVLAGARAASALGHGARKEKNP